MIRTLTFVKRAPIVGEELAAPLTYDVKANKMIRETLPKVTSIINHYKYESFSVFEVMYADSTKGYVLEPKEMRVMITTDASSNNSRIDGIGLDSKNNKIEYDIGFAYKAHSCVLTAFLGWKISEYTTIKDSKLLVVWYSTK